MRGVAARAAVPVILCLAFVITVGSTLSASASSSSSSSSSTRRSSLAAIVIPYLGPGYTVVSQGPLGASQIVSSSPNPTAAAAALSRLSHSGSITTYARIWQDAGRNNEVEDLVVRCTSVSDARAFYSAVRDSLSSGEVVSSGPLRAIPGAYRATYFASTTQDGVGQAITMQSGNFVATLSYFSSNSASNTQPISLDDAVNVAKTQHVAINAADLKQRTVGQAETKKKKSGASSLLVILLALALALALAFFLVARWRYLSAHSSPNPVPLPEPPPEPPPEPETTQTSEIADGPTPAVVINAPDATRQTSSFGRLTLAGTAALGGFAYWLLRRRSRQ